MNELPKILVIADYPTKQEVNTPFCGAASMLLKSNLREAFAKTGYPLKTKNIKYTYLSPNRLQTRLDEDIFSKKQLQKETLHNFTKLEYLKDTYLSPYFSSCFDNLLELIKEFQPDIIVTSGKYSFYLLGCYVDSDEPVGTLSQVKTSNKKQSNFGNTLKFRGSTMRLYPQLGIQKPTLLVPIIPHAYQAYLSANKTSLIDYTRIGYLNAVLTQDNNNIREFLDYKPNTKVFDDYKAAMAFLRQLTRRLNRGKLTVTLDLETASNSIDTFGIALSPTEGYAIPLLKYEKSITKKYKSIAYTKKGKEEQVFLGSSVRTLTRMYTFEEEVKLARKINEVVLHPNLKKVGHNFHYDGLYLKSCFGSEVHAEDDTMVLGFTINNTQKKNLAYLCSITLKHYAYWKDDLKTADERRWHYCAKDCMFDYELYLAQQKDFKMLPKGAQDWYYNRQRVTGVNLLRRMFSGLAVDLKKRDELFEEFTDLHISGIRQIQTLVGYPININSIYQIRDLFLEKCLNIDPILDRKRGTPTFGNAAMLKYMERYPEYAYLFQLIVETKSISTFINNFLKARLNEFDELTAFTGVVGTKSGRFNATKHLNGEGTNNMNWSTGGRHPLKVVLNEYEAFSDESDIDEDFFSKEDGQLEDTDLLEFVLPESKLEKAVPNSKQIIIAHKGRFLANRDLASGDLYVVAWMANAKWVKDCLLSGGDVYTELGSEYYGIRLLKKDARRDAFKKVCHALNYLGMAKTIALNAGLSVYEVEKIAYFYFDKNPEIQTNYQNKIINDCLSFGKTTGLFGLEYNCPTTDLNVDKTWQQKMCAVVAQGAVADWINIAIDNTHEGESKLILPFRERGLRPIEPKLQVHDAGLFEVDYLDKYWLDRLDTYFDISKEVKCIDGTTSILKIPSSASSTFINYSLCK